MSLNKKTKNERKRKKELVIESCTSANLPLIVTFFFLDKNRNIELPKANLSLIHENEITTYFEFD